MKMRMALLGLAAAGLFAGCGGTPGKVLAKIDGEKITEGDMQSWGDINPRLKQQMSDPAGLKRILDLAVEQELTYQEALKEGLDRDSKVRTKLDLLRKNVIAQALIEAEVEKAAKKYYDEHQEEFKKLALSHIMVKYASADEIKKAKKGEKLRTEEDALKAAREIRARLDGGEDFAKVAKEASDDVATKSRGGDLGAASRNDKRLEARGFGPVLEKAFELKVGELAGPIKTDKGYHIIALTRGVEMEPFDAAKQGIMIKAQGPSRQDLLARLRKDAKISYPEQEKREAEAKKKAGEAAAPAAPAEAKPDDAAAQPEAKAGEATASPEAK